jgi:hypothetical protein
MPRRLLFEIDGRTFPATLHDTPTADAIWNALPLDCAYSVWGDEIFFDCGVRLSPDDGQETVALGDVGYWPPGSAICLFYGSTPMSGPGEIRPASAVSVFGKLEGDPKSLKSLRGRRVNVRRAG